MSRKKDKNRDLVATKQVVDPTANTAGNAKTATKKAIVLGTRSNRHRTLAAVVGIVVLVAGGIYFANHRLNAAGGHSPAGQAPVSAGAATTESTYPATLFKDGNARHFEYKGPAGTIKYFILKSSDGVIRAAFDACDVCWRAAKGYYQAGDYMICRNCSQQFASTRINEVKGGCNPSPLKRSIEGSHVVIRINDILEGSQYFNFSGRT